MEEIEDITCPRVDIPVICMGYPIYLGIALWLPLKEVKTLYHVCKYPAYK